MKQRIRQLILISLLSFAGTVAFGQVNVGVSAGVNGAHGAFDQSLARNRVALGFHAGLLSRIGLHKSVYLQPGLQYSLQGWSLSHIARGSRMNLHYLNLPLLVGYQPVSRLSLLIGPQMGLLLRANLQSESTADFTSIFRKMDAGISLGATYHLSSQLGLAVRYIHGLTYLTQATVTDANGNPIGTRRDGHNRTLQIGIAYLFGENK
jgi:hypothetical protein